MIDAGHPRLSIVRQCALASISRSSFYREPTAESEETLRLMRLIDEQFLETPWYGSRQMARHLRRNGWCVGRHRVRRLMLKMGLAPIYQRPKTSEPHPQHRIWPYLLRHLTIDRPNQIWCADVTYIPIASRLPVPGRDHGLVQPARFWRGGYRARWMPSSV
jgi:putative transposase